MTIKKIEIKKIKKKLPYDNWERYQDAKGRMRDSEKRARKAERLDLCEEKNLTGTKLFAAQMGNLKTGQQLPF